MTPGGDARRWAIEVGGWSIAIEADPGLVLAPEGASRLFVSSPAHVDLTLRVRLGTCELPADARPGFDSEGVWRAFETPSHVYLSMRSSLFDAGPYAVLRAPRDWGQAELFVHPAYAHGRSIDPLEYPVDELLFLRLVTEGGGLEVHAAGVDAGARGGWLLLGHSGAGKSTASRIILEAGLGSVLSDDRIILRRAEDGWWMFGTPWHGTAQLASPRGCPLRRIYILSHGKTNRLGTLPLSTFAAEIAARTFHPLYSPQSLPRALATVERVAREVPCRTLAFHPDPEMAWLLASDSDGSTRQASPR